MSRDVWCIHCQQAYAHLGGAYPETCPACQMPAFWTTEPMPVIPYRLNENDRRFLRAIKVKPDA